jgi:hypothetical protein
MLAALAMGADSLFFHPAGKTVGVLKRDGRRRLAAIT